MLCLVTGAAGFVGSTLSERLLRDGHTVRAIDCFTDYYDTALKRRNLEVALKHPEFKFVDKDLCTIDMAELLDGVEWVFHQAAQAGVRRSWGEYFSTYTENNIGVTQRLLESCKGRSGIQSIVYASSSSVYGDAEDYPTSENTIPRPVSPYGVTKLAAEHLMRLYASEFDVPTVSLRYFTVFGPRQRPDMAFHKFIKAILKGEGIDVYGDGEQSRDFTFIEDIVEANVLAATAGKPGQVFNIGGGTNATLKQVLEILQNRLGDFPVSYQARQAGDARHTSADTSLARTDLGFAPQISLEEGIEREIEWMHGLLEECGS